MFENLLLIVLTIHCCFASFIIHAYCSRVVLWLSFVFTCAVKLLEVSSFILTYIYIYICFISYSMVHHGKYTMYND